MNEKERYTKYSLIIIILLLGGILFVRLIPFLSGILGAVTIYALLRGQMKYLSEKKKMKRSLAAILLIGETVLFFLIPLSLFVWLLIGELQTLNLDPAVLMSSVEDAVQVIREKTGYELFKEENMSAVASFFTKLAQSFLGNVSGLIMNLFVLVFILFFMLIGSSKMEEYVYSILPFGEADRKSVLKEMNRIVTSNAIGIPLLAVIQGGIAMAGYFIFGAPNALLFGFLTCFATVIPLVGTALIWLPLVVYMALLGDWVNAAGLAAYALIIITNVDNLIRFMLQKKMANIHPLITVFGVVIGLPLFGFMGVIFGPLLISVFILCFDIYKREYLDK